MCSLYFTLKSGNTRKSKEKVIVVLDDLSESTLQEKRRILQEQPSIGRYSQDLILFSQTEKKAGFKQNTLEPLKKTLKASLKPDSSLSSSSSLSSNQNQNFFSTERKAYRGGNSQSTLSSEGPEVSRGKESASAFNETHPFSQKLDQILSIVSNQKQQLEEFKKDLHMEISKLNKEHSDEISRLIQHQREDISRLMQKHQEEISRLNKQHREDISRLNKQH
ncbi:uncharacterized protein LOC121398004 [Xenopus laevis]|uniref:Uncharacterized protein LOC121398004 n=2 Tax=Xenopus laevis TaxID=8355 RepID=A0A8J1LRW1_XENLA|nr:uncharacterized protein LOC121398004 [Xenopus laevis]